MPKFCLNPFGKLINFYNFFTYVVIFHDLPGGKYLKLKFLYISKWLQWGSVGSTKKEKENNTNKNIHNNAIKTNSRLVESQIPNNFVIGSHSIKHLC